MNCLAYEFVCACEAGLQLAGQEDNAPQWMGTHKNWYDYEALIYAQVMDNHVSQNTNTD